MADLSRLPGPNADLWDWQLDGACRRPDPDLFFHPEGERGPSRRQPRRRGQGGLRRLPGAGRSAARTRWPSASRTASGAACPRTTARRSTPHGTPAAAWPPSADPRARRDSPRRPRSPRT